MALKLLILAKICNIKTCGSVHFTNNQMLFQVFHRLQLNEGQHVTALALNMDNTNLLVSTATRELIIFTDPAVSLIYFSIECYNHGISV